MRKTGDRIRHAISFEIISLAIITPLGAWVFGLPMLEMGVVGLGSAMIATLWNYLFNLGFDHALLRLRGTVAKSFRIRIGHALLFEAGLLGVLIPFIAAYLGVSLWEAFLLDVSLAGFFLVYAFVFNWAYDQIFPVHETRQPVAATH